MKMVTPLLSSFLKNSKIQFQHYGIALLIFLLGLLLSLVAFRFYKMQDIHRTQAEFDRIADLRLFLIKDVFSGTLEQLEYIKQFYYASEKITEKDFDIFVRASFHFYPNLLALGWIETNSYPGMGKGSSLRFEFIDFTKLPSIQIAHFFPFTYLETPSFSAPFYLDDAYYPPFLDFVHNSHQHTSTTLSSSIKFIQEGKESTGFFMFKPIFFEGWVYSPRKKGLFGTLVAFSNFEDIVQNMRSRVKPTGINISIYDISEELPQLLYRDEALALKDPSTLSLQERELQDHWTRSHVFNFGNRKWKLEAVPTLEFIREHQSKPWNYWEIFLLGPLLSTIIASYFLVLVNRRMLIEQEVQQRTNELATINRVLQQEIHEREQMERTMTLNQDYLQRRQEALDYLTKFTISEPQHGIHEVILRTANVMQIDRVGVWFYKESDQTQILSCEGVYILSTNTFANGIELMSPAFPHYFQVLANHSPLILPSSDNAELNQELSSYLAVFHITSKMDIPILFEGNLLGILSCEETRGHREWELEDRHFGQAIADIIATMITESARRKAEKALKESETRLLKAIKEAKAANEAKNEFLATISHELRTPLNAIIGFNQCLLMGMDGPVNQQQASSLERIEKSSFHLLNLINDILDLAKIEAHRMELEVKPYNVVEIVRSSVEEMLPFAEKKNLKLSFVVDQPFILLEVDKMRIRQVLFNLLSNAIKFTETGSITVTLVNRLNQVEIRVTDTGIGLTPEEIAKLFSPFSQADSSITRKYGGTGLGLIISKNIVNLHHGTITVESQKHRGSTFIITLPKNENPKVNS